VAGQIIIFAITVQAPNRAAAMAIAPVVSSVVASGKSRNGEVSWTTCVAGQFALLRKQLSRGLAMPKLPKKLMLEACSYGRTVRVSTSSALKRIGQYVTEKSAPE
jgi:hypothetical protein